MFSLDKISPRWLRRLVLAITAPVIVVLYFLLCVAMPILIAIDDWVRDMAYQMRLCFVAIREVWRQ